jgi:hypothetical protein
MNTRHAINVLFDLSTVSNYTILHLDASVPSEGVRDPGVGVPHEDCKVADCRFSTWLREA